MKNPSTSHHVMCVSPPAYKIFISDRVLRECASANVGRSPGAPSAFEKVTCRLGSNRYFPAGVFLGFVFFPPLPLFLAFLRVFSMFSSLCHIVLRSIDSELHSYVYFACYHGFFLAGGCFFVAHLETPAWIAAIS